MSMNMDTDITLRLNWRQTWPDKPDDYVCTVKGHRGSVGRIMRFDAGPQPGRWQWCYQAMLDGVTRVGELTGVSDTPRRAALEIEKRWVADLEKSGRRRS